MTAHLIGTNKLLLVGGIEVNSNNEPTPIVLIDLFGLTWRSIDINVCTAALHKMYYRTVPFFCRSKNLSFSNFYVKSQILFFILIHFLLNVVSVKNYTCNLPAFTPPFQ